MNIYANNDMMVATRAKNGVMRNGLMVVWNGFAILGLVIMFTERKVVQYLLRVCTSLEGIKMKKQLFGCKYILRPSHKKHVSSISFYLI